MISEEMKEQLLKVQEFTESEESGVIEPLMYCDYCGEPMLQSEIEVEHKHKVDVAYFICTNKECGQRFNLMFDSKKTSKLKDKIKLTRKIEQDLQAQLMVAMLEAEDMYYSKEYEALSDKEKELVGGYVPSLDKDKVEEFNNRARTNYSKIDVLKLL